MLFRNLDDNCSYRYFVILLFHYAILLFSIIKRKKINNFITIVLKHNPNAFYSVEDIKSVSEGNMLGINKNPEIQKITRKRKGK